MKDTLQEKTTELTPLLELRIGAYRFLKNIFMEEPKLEFIKALIKEKKELSFPFVESCSIIHKGETFLLEYLNEFNLNTFDEFEQLHWDYTRMYIGPNKLLAPIWGSAYLDEKGLLFQQETLRVRRAFCKYGFVQNNEFVEADDHLGYELDYMLHLSEFSLAEVIKNDREKALYYLTDQKKFLEEHLKWVPQFSTNVLQNANTKFYQGAALLLKGFIETDFQLIDEIIEYLRT
jgi:putative dimethyl sulfoxide reductase chaperone